VTTAGAPPEPTGVQADLGWALGTVLRAYIRAADMALGGVPGGARGYRLLSSVARDCPGSQLALAQLTGLDRTVVTYLLDDLVEAGLVERKPDAADRRMRRVSATAAGSERLARAEEQLRRVEDHLLAGLSTADRQALRGLLQRAALHLVAAGAEEPSCNGVVEALMR
jgi:DNA-binding MarR family transcriptional regulator